MENILAGLELLLRPEPILWLVFGVVAGFMVGALPGFVASNAVALVLPFSVALPIESALILMVAVYAGASFAGSMPAILINVPGTPESAATALDGYPMAQSGQAERAIGIARMSSVCGGVISAVIVLTVIGPLSSIALQFGARELFVLVLFGLFVISSVVGDDIRKGLIAALAGLLIAAMSANPLTAQPRFTLGFLELYEEVPLVPAIIGLFAFSQMFVLATQDRLAPAEDGEGTSQEGGAPPQLRLRSSIAEVWGGIRTTLSYPVDIVRSALLGSLIGIIPGVGTTVANFVSYGIAKRSSKTPEDFGKGAPQGIISSETCDNAVASGTLVPTLALGIPGSATAAIMLAALYLHGVQPGPQVMSNNAPEAYAVLLSMLVASLLILPLGVLLAAPLSRVTRIRPVFIVSAVMLVGVVGSFAVRNSLFDVGLALMLGLLGLLMRQYGYPVVPLVLGLVLGPLAEENFLRALSLGNNELGYFLGSNIAVILWILLIALIVFNVVKALWKRRQGQEEEERADGE